MLTFPQAPSEPRTPQGVLHAGGATAAPRVAAANDAAAAAGTPAAAAASAWPAARVAYGTLFVLVLCLTSNQLDVAIVPYLSPYIKADLHLSDTELGLLLGVPFALFYTLVGIPISWFVDRYSRRWILALGVLTWNVGTALCGAAQSYLQLFVARFLVGAGEGVNGPTSYSMVADLFPRERIPRGIAWLQVGTMLGKAVAMLASAWLLYRFVDKAPIAVFFGVIHGWQLVFLLIGLPSTLIAVLLLLRPEPVRHRIASQMPPAMRAASERLHGLAGGLRDFGVALAYMRLHRRVFAPLFGSLLASSFAAGAQAWEPIFFLRTFGWQPSRLALLQPIIQLGVMPVGMVLGVWLAERLARRQRADAALRVFIIARLIALPAVASVLLPTPWLAFALGALYNFGLGVGSPSQNAALQIVTPAELRGKITALYLLLYSGIGLGLVPILYGAINDFVLRDEAMIRWAIFWPTLVFNPLCILIAWLGLGAYGREVKRLGALEA